MRLQTARLTHGIWQFRRAHETNWYFVRPCTLYNTLIELVLFLYSGKCQIFSFSSLLHLHLHWSLACARNLVTQWKNPAGPTSSFLPVERDETYFVVPWMPSILLCIRWWAQNVCHDVVVVAWLTLPYSFHLDTTLFFATHTHTDQLYGNPCLFILSLPFIYLLPPPAFLFCFTILWWWVTLFDIHAPLPSSFPQFFI